MMPRIFLITLRTFLLISCDVTERWSEYSRMDEEYADYVKRTQIPEPQSKKLRRHAPAPEFESSTPTPTGKIKSSRLAMKNSPPCGTSFPTCI